MKNKMHRPHYMRDGRKTTGLYNVENFPAHAQQATPRCQGQPKRKTKPAEREISRNLQEVSKKETSKNNRLIKNSGDRNTSARHNGTAQEDPNRTRMRYSTQKALMMICWPRSKHVRLSCHPCLPGPVDENMMFPLHQD